MDKVVVIGGGGFIGRALVRRLVDAGYAVTVVSRSSKSTSGPVEYLKGEVADAARMLEIIKGARYVYDLSMSLGTKWSDYERDYIGGARNVATACLEHGVERLLYTSSISALYLGSGRKTDERDGYDPYPEKRGFYGRGKIEAERVLLDFHKTRKLNVVIFRPGIVLGPGGMLAHGALGDIVSDIFIQGFGSGTHPLPCVLVDDVADAMFTARNTPGIEGMSFNLAGDVRPTAREYIEQLRRFTGRNFQYIPRSVLKIGAIDRFKWLIKLLVRKADNVCEPYRDYKSLTMSSFLDCTLAKEKLNWRPVSDREEFFRQAIGVHVKPLPEGDLRLRKLNPASAAAQGHAMLGRGKKTA